MRTAWAAWPLGLTLLTAAVGGAAEPQVKKPPLGEWEVVELSGSISREATGSSFVCTGASTQSALLDSELNSIYLGWDETAFGGEYSEPPPGIPERITDRQAQRPFLFTLAFENGHHSNTVSGLDRRGGVMVHNPWAGGFWGLADDGGGIVQGFVATAQEVLGSGTNKFTVDGTFQGRERLVGNWSFEEAIVGFGCTWTAKGKGRWAAVPKR